MARSSRSRITKSPLCDQVRRQVVLGLAGAFAGIAVAGAGLMVFYLPPPVLVGLLLILVRMNGPAAALRQHGQQLAQILPAYRSLMDLQAELSAAAAPNPTRTGD